MTSDIGDRVISLRRLIWVGPVTIAAAVVAVVAVQAVAVAMLQPLPRLMRPLVTSIEPAVVTIVCVTAAVLVFAVIGHEAIDPIRTYQRTAFAVLIVSFLPDVALAMTAAPGVNVWPFAIVFMVMHVAAWAVTVTLLTRLTVVSHKQRADESAPAVMP